MTIRTGMGFKFSLAASSQCPQPRKLRHGRRRRLHNREDLILILARYSWLLIIFTVANYFCLVTSNSITATKSGSDNNNKTDFTTTTSSTIRPWPSHEFFQNVMKGKVVNENEASSSSSSETTTEVARAAPDRRKPQQISDQNNQNQSVSTTKTTTTKNRLRENKKLNDTFEISPSNLTSQNDTTRVKIVKEISREKFLSVPRNPHDPGHKKVPPSPSSSAAIKSTTNGSSWTNKNNPNTNENITSLTNNKGKAFLKRLGNTQEAQVESEQRGSLKKSLNLGIYGDDNKNSKNDSSFESRRWLSLASSSSTSKNGDDDDKKNPATFLPPTVETAGGLPFRVSPIKKTRPRTELSPEFYAKLAGIEGGGNNNNRHRHGHQDQDYVNDDERLEWWHAEDKEKFAASTVKPPKFTRLTWPYNNKKEKEETHLGGGLGTNPIKKLPTSIMKHQKQIIPFPVITSSSSLSSSLKYATTTMRPISLTMETMATTVQPIFPILFSSAPPYNYNTNNRLKVKNKISPPSLVHHWGSSGSQQIVRTTKSPATTTNHLFLPAGFVRVNVTGGGRRPGPVSLSESSDHSTTATGIKLSADVITSTDSSVVAQLSQVLLSSVPGNKATEEEEDGKNNNFQGFGGSVTGTKTPTNTIWYKPVINHYSSSSNGGGGSGIIPATASSAGSTSWNWNQHDHHQQQQQHHLDDNEKGEQVEQKKENEGSSSSLSTTSGSAGQVRPATTKLGGTRDEEKEKGEGHILFKLWNYANGTLQLNNQKKIPSWILKDFPINDDQVLNLNELPETVQKIVEDRFLPVKGKAGFYSHHPPGEKEGEFDSYWQQLPILQYPEEEQGKYPSEISSYDPHNNHGGQRRRRPVSLNYILWNHEDPPSPPTKSPHDFLLHNHGHQHQGNQEAEGGEFLDLHDASLSTQQLQNYLQHALQKPKPYFNDPSSESNWGKLESFLKQQAAGGVPYLALLESIQNHSPTQNFPWSQKFEDKDISNLVAVSLILSYLNKNKEENPENSAQRPLPSPSPSPSPSENEGPLHSLFSSPSPSEKDQNWDAIRPVLQHTKPFNDNNDPSYLFSSPGPSAAPTKSPPHQGYVFDTMTTKAPPRQGYIFDTMTTAPTATGVAATAPTAPGNFDHRFHSHEEYDDEENLPKKKPTKRPSKNSVTLERGETSEVEEHEGPHDGGGGGHLTKTLLEKKKLFKKKKHKKKLKKKKGYYENFGIKLDVGTDLVAHLKDKFMALLNLQYAPLIILCMAMLGPALMIGSPYIMKMYRNRFSNRNNQGYYEGEEVDQAHTYIYPYNYAYPVVPQTTGSTSYGGYPIDFDDPYDDQYQEPKGVYYTPKGRGRRGGNSRSRKKSNVEIHHHFHDIPIVAGPTGTFSQTYPIGVTGNLQQQQQQPQQQFGSILDLQQNGADEFGPHDHVGFYGHEQQSDYTEPLPSSSSSSPHNDNDAEGYMEKIRDIGRNLGLLIGSTISDSKSDAIRQIIEQWSSFSPADSSKPEYRDSDEDHEFFRRKLPPVRKLRSEKKLPPNY